MTEQRCEECHGKMEYRAIPIYGDFSLGIRAEWLACVNCGATRELHEHPAVLEEE